MDALRTAIRPSTPGFNGDVSGQLSPEDAAALKARALAAINAWRDAGCLAPYQPDQAELLEMVNFAVGMELPEDYAPLVIEDMAYEAEDPRTFQWNQPVSDEAKAHYPLLVTGGACLAC
jgi:4-hydroxyacetophenone monooxygenase